jgi:hypothetical protein
MSMLAVVVMLVVAAAAAATARRNSAAVPVNQWTLADTVALGPEPVESAEAVVLGNTTVSFYLHHRHLISIIIIIITVWT